MHRLPITVLALLALLVPAARAHGSDAAFQVRFDPRIAPEGELLSGRLVVYLLSSESTLYRTNQAANGPFFFDPQPMFGVTLEDHPAGEPVLIGDDATAYPAPPSELEPGYYRVQAVLDRSRTNSDWKREAGNLYSDEFTINVREGTPPSDFLVLVTNRTEPEPWPEDAAERGVHIVEVTHPGLDGRLGGPTALRAAVVEPIGYDPSKDYPAIYFVPGFGGDHTRALSEVGARQRLRMDDPARMLRARAFLVYLDPESGNGHHLFVNSHINGPVGDALADSLIPAIESRFPLIQRPEARIITGHSSGGWASLFAAVTRPDVFGACWSTAPDPVDFRAFQQSDLYEDNSLYFKAGGELGSYRSAGAVRMSVRTENLMEEVLGPGNTSGQQWDSWWCAFGVVDDNGAVRPPVDPLTGEIDHEVTALMGERFDINRLVRAEEGPKSALFRRSVRLLMGDQDNYYLERAALLLKETLAEIGERRGEPDPGARVRIIEGADHSTLLRTPAARSISREMLEHIASIGRG